MVTTSCNNDIFIDDITPGETEVTIDGDGGTASVRFEPKALQHISIDTYGSPSDITYYDHSGNIIESDSPVSDVARINYTGRSFIFDIYIKKDILTFISTERAGGSSSMIVPVRLDYGFTVEFIDVYVTPGQPAEISHFSYDMSDLRAIPLTEIKRSATTFTNSSGTDAIYGEMPFINLRGTVDFTPQQSWLNGYNIEVPYPVMNDDASWSISTEKTDIRIGTTMKYIPDYLDRTLRINYTVPDGATVRFTCEVPFTGAEVPFTVTVRNPVSGREFYGEGMCRVSQPVEEYNIVCENV